VLTRVSGRNPKDYNIHLQHVEQAAKREWSRIKRKYGEHRTDGAPLEKSEKLRGIKLPPYIGNKNKNGKASTCVKKYGRWPKGSIN